MFDCGNIRAASVIGLTCAVAVLVLLLIASEVRDYGKDEIVTYNVVRTDWRELTVDRLKNTHSPVYFWLLKPYANAVADPIAIRYPSALLAAVSVGVLTAVMAFTCSAAAAIFLGIGFVSSPALMAIGHLARPYALLLVFTAIALACSAVLLQSRDAGAESRNGDRSRHARYAWPLLQISLIGAAATMMAGVLSALAISTAPYLSDKIRADRKFTRQWLRRMVPVFIACALVVLVLSPYLWERAGSYWADDVPLSIATFIKIFRTGFTDKFAVLDLRLQSLIQGIVLVSSVAFFLIGIAKRKQFLPMYLPAAALAIGLTLVLTVISLHTGLLVDRYFYVAVPAILCVMALGASVVLKYRFGLIALLMLAPLFASQGIGAALSTGSVSISVLEPASRTIAKYADERDEIISTPPGRKQYLDFFLHDWEASDSRFNVSGGPWSVEDLGHQIQSLLRNRRAVWLVAEARYGQLNLHKIASGHVEFCRLQAEPVLIAMFFTAGSPMPQGIDCPKLESGPGIQ